MARDKDKGVLAWMGSKGQDTCDGSFYHCQYVVMARTEATSNA